MKNLSNNIRQCAALLITGCLLSISALKAQDSATVAKKIYARNTFEGNYMIDNQSVVIPIKHTLEADIQHRFGTVNNGLHDFYGFYNVSNVRLAVSYTLCNNFQLGLGLVGDRMQTDLNAKLALLKQTKDGSMPFSLTYYGNIAVDPRGPGYDSTATFTKTGDHFSYFNPHCSYP